MIDIVIDLWSSWNFANMENIIKTYNPTVKFSKFTSNKKINLIDIAIDLWSSWNFTNVENIIKTYNPMIRFSKFTSSKKIKRESLIKGFLSKLTT